MAASLDRTDWPALADELLARIRRTRPLVQCLTNTVTTGFVANGLLALGATPAMVDIPGEAGLFAGVAAATLINVGTPASEQRAAMLEAAQARPKRWVLDPVAVGALPIRTALARQLRDLGPTVIRGNASEIRALAGTGQGGKGVDATDAVDSVVEEAHALARSSGAVVAVSGAVDLVTDGTRSVRIANGDPIMTRVVGTGCLLGAVVAAFVAVADDAFEGTVAACALYAVAGELAGQGTQQPGAYAVAFLDALSALDGAALARRGHVR